MVMMDGEPLFIDTNVLIAASDPDRTEHLLAQTTLQASLDGNVHLLVSGQVIREYQVVATRPAARNGLGLSPRETAANVNMFLTLAGFLEEDRLVFDQLQVLIGKHDLKGKRIHDANIAATLIRHGLKRILTSNAADFKVFTQIVTVGLVDMSVE